MTNMPTPGTVRWYVSEYMRRQLARSSAPYLEIGSRRRDDQWWVDLCGQSGIDRDLWTGLDIEGGPNVDVVWDVTRPEIPTDMRGMFGTVVCAEVMEHVTDPAAALASAWAFLAPGGRLIVTSPFAFPIHGYPSDYWRFTPDAMLMMMRRAGFVDAESEGMHTIEMQLQDHESVTVTRAVPMHVGATCLKPAGKP